MRYAGTRRSEHNPLRSIPTLQTAALFQEPTETDRLVGDLRNALWSVTGLARAYDAAQAGLGRANGHNKTLRRASQRDAMGALNKARGAMRSNARQIATLQARLLALPVPADVWADAAASAARYMVVVHHPDAALLILCGELRTLQEEWQRLWAATPETGEPGPADKAWRDYSDHVWPGVCRHGAKLECNPVRSLIILHATTLEDMRAKVAGIKATDDAAGYLTSIRDDSYELMISLLQDVDGLAVMPIGEDANQIALVAGE